MPCNTQHTRQMNGVSVEGEECPATHNTHITQNTNKSCKCKRSITDKTSTQQLLPITSLYFTSLFCAVTVYWSFEVVTNLKKKN